MYSGERQAEKNSAELQIRRRRSHESLSELHHDIRSLMALAYPRLMAEAREEIACDHFTNAFSDRDFALKVKERAPKSLDEALNVLDTEVPCLVGSCCDITIGREN